MRIGCHYPDGAAGCCPAGIYGVLITESFTSLKDNGSGTRTLQTYLKADHADFALVLSEHAQLSKFHYMDLTDFELPATPEGQYYTLEFWKSAVNGVYDRDDDLLFELRRFIWDGQNYAESRLSSLESISEYEVRVATSYDSNTNTLHCMASLFKDGEHVSDPISCNIKIVTGTNQVIAESNLTYQQLSQAPGVFSWDEPGQNLMPDRVYVIYVTIVDGDGGPHTSVAYQITWD